MKRTAIFAALAALTILSTPAEAKRAQSAEQQITPRTDLGAVVSYPFPDQKRPRAQAQAASHRAAGKPGYRKAREVNNATPEPRQGQSGPRDMGGRSGSCLRFPKTQYLWCGCGAADEVGLDNGDGHWNLAANYFGLPRSEPGYNKIAVRYGHVAVLKSQVAGSIWMAFDPNGGHQRAWLHEIDLRQFRAIVDPTGVRSTVHAADVGIHNHSRHKRHRIRYARR